MKLATLTQATREGDGNDRRSARTRRAQLDALTADMLDDLTEYLDGVDIVARFTIR